MAQAKNNSTAEAWDTLQAAYPLVLKICISPSRAGACLAELIFVTKQVRLRWREANPPDASIELFYRQGWLPTINFSDNSVQTWEVTSPGATGMCHVFLLGVEVARGDIMAQQPAGIEVAGPGARAGRPTTKHLIEKEAKRRMRNDATAGVLKQLRAYGFELSDWLRREYPRSPPMGARTVENNVRSIWKSIKSRNPIS